MATKDTGNIYEDCVQNVVEVLHNNRTKLGLKEIHDTEVSVIPKFPCVTVEFDTAEEEWVRIPNRKKISTTLSITYYHEELTERTRLKELRKQLDELADILRRNWDVNGYCGTHGSSVESVTSHPIALGSQWIAGGLIIFTCMKEITVTLA